MRSKKQAHTPSGPELKPFTWINQAVLLDEDKFNPMTDMTGRERVLAAIHHQAPDRVPRDILLERRVEEMLEGHFGTKDLRKALRMDVAYVHPAPTQIKHDFRHYFTRLGVVWDEWGRGRIWDTEQHYAEYLYPLEHAETVDELLAYPWPDIAASYRYEGLAERVDWLHRQGYAVIGETSETTFEIAWQLRSMDRLFEDILHEDEKAAIILDHVTERNMKAGRRLAQAGVDILYIGDDVAMQTGLMMSKKMWRKWFFPRLKQAIDAARAVRPEIPVKYHSDGKINDLIPDLIESGVTILNPVQPECVDHRWVKDTYGKQLSFDGGLGVQSVLPFGTPEEVRSHVHQVIRTLGEGGGLVVGPSHVVERDTPLENILAMVEAMDEFRY